MAFPVPQQGAGWEAVPMPPGQRHQAVTALARAFWPDPLFGFFARTAVQEHRMLPVFFGPLVDDGVRHGQVWTAAATDGQVAAAAAWLAPGAYPRGLVREAAIYRGAAAALAQGRNRAVGLRLLGEVDRRHPDRPHWYLALLGSDPRWRGRGAARAVLAPVLERADADAMPAYLETQRQENLAFYARFGFELHDEVRLPGAPPVWLLWREPRPPG